MPDGPDVAVVVGAFHREQFLVAALRSVLGQTYSRERVEIVVTKSFESREVDQFLAEQRIPSRLDSNPRIGRWLLDAVAETKAPYIAFLDDDDEFLPDRLAHALEVLRGDPTLGFYRNRVEVIDEHGDPAPRSTWRPNELDRFFDTAGPVRVPPDRKSEVAALGLEQTRVTFNSSTMVVRRDLLEGELGATFARTQLPDVALFVLAAVSRFGLYLDDRRLTRYRRYPGNVTGRVPWLGHARESYADLAALAERHGARPLAERLRRTSDHYDRVFRSSRLVEKVSAGASRAEVARDASEYLRFLGRHPIERAWTLEVWAAEMYAAMYVLAPSIARRVSRRQGARTTA